MPHCDEETLSLLALGERGPGADQAHLVGCERCRAELSGLRRVVTTARTVAHPPADAPTENELDALGLGRTLDVDVWAALPRSAPPARVWDQIAAATGVRTGPHLDEVLQPSPAPRPKASMPPRPRSLTSRLDPRLLAVAAGGLVIGVLAGVIGTRLIDATGPDPAPVVAATRLDGLPAAPSASGQADVTESAQGRTLDLTVRQLGAPDGFYEVWLIDPTVTKMVPVGVLTGATGRFTVPAGVNLADYPLVDVSLEPLDGDPAHSGQSVLRGRFRS